MNGGQVVPDISGIVRAIVVVVVVLFFGWLLLAWAVVKRPILALPAAAFTGLVLLVGMHDAQALAIYLLGAMWIWRRAHRTSSMRDLVERYQMSERWFRYRLAEGMPAHRWGGRWRFRASEVEAWMEARGAS